MNSSSAATYLYGTMNITVAPSPVSNTAELVRMDEGLFWRAETTEDGAMSLLAESNAGGPAHIAELPGALRSIFKSTPFTVWVGREYSRVIYVAWPAENRFAGAMQALAARFEADESTPAPDYFPVPAGMKAWRLWWD